MKKYLFILLIIVVVSCSYNIKQTVVTKKKEIYKTVYDTLHSVTIMVKGNGRHNVDLKDYISSGVVYYSYKQIDTIINGYEIKTLCKHKPSIFDNKEKLFISWCSEDNVLNNKCTEYNRGLEWVNQQISIKNEKVKKEKQLKNIKKEFNKTKCK